MRIVFFCNDIGFFKSHFLTLAKKTAASGARVVVLAGGNCPQAEKELLKFGADFVPFKISRSGLNPFLEVLVLFRLWLLMLQLRPDCVHLFTIKPCIYGGIVTRLTGARRLVATVTGLGYAFSGDTFFCRLRRYILIKLYRLAFGGQRRNATVVFENQDDLEFFVSHKIVFQHNASRVWGAGVDLDRFSPSVFTQAEVSGHGFLRVLLPARMLKDKGVLEFISAARSLRRLGAAVEMVLMGNIDPDNPASLQSSEIRNWEDEGVIRWLGYRRDVPDQLRNADIICLPSYREGMPKVLLEAMAVGKPVITTDVPGCREAIESGVQGWIVEVKSSKAIEQAVRRFVDHPELVQQMGLAARRRAELLFSDVSIAQQYIKLYGLANER